VPTIYHRSRILMVGTLRFAHPTVLRTDLLRYELRTDLLRAQARSWYATATNQPDGQISQNLSSPSRKNIPL